MKIITHKYTQPLFLSLSRARALSPTPLPLPSFPPPLSLSQSYRAEVFTSVLVVATLAMVMRVALIAAAMLLYQQFGTGKSARA